MHYYRTIIVSISVFICTSIVSANTNFECCSLEDMICEAPSKLHNLCTLKPCLPDCNPG